jgi:hypothetical protein
MGGIMDCLDEWGAHVQGTVLELGDVMETIDYEQRAEYASLCVEQLWMTGIASSREVGYLMLMEAYRHAGLKAQMAWFYEVLDTLRPIRYKVSTKKKPTRTYSKPLNGSSS